jgi:hypothetical protein
MKKTEKGSILGMLKRRGKPRRLYALSKPTESALVWVICVKIVMMPDHLGTQQTLFSPVERSTRRTELIK